MTGTSVPVTGVYAVPFIRGESPPPSPLPPPYLPPCPLFRQLAHARTVLSPPFLHPATPIGGHRARADRPAGVFRWESPREVQPAVQTPARPSTFWWPAFGPTYPTPRAIAAGLNATAPITRFTWRFARSQVLAHSRRFTLTCTNCSKPRTRSRTRRRTGRLGAGDRRCVVLRQRR